MSVATLPSARSASSSPRRRARRSNCWRKDGFMGDSTWRGGAARSRRGATRAPLTLVVEVAAAAAQEQARDRLRKPPALVAFGGVELRERAVQHLLRQTARERVEHVLDVAAAGEQLPGARDLERSPVVGLRV